MLNLTHVKFSTPIEKRLDRKSETKIENFRKIRVVPLASGYPFFAQNASIEPHSVHACLLGLVGVPRAQRAAVAPYYAAWGRKPAGAQANFSRFAWFERRRAKFSTRAVAAC